jgi:ABC-type Fe3+-hydroxamate transport system substrate-binding protein
MQVLDAVKHHRVYPISSDVFVIPGPRVVDAARSIFAMLHPAAEKSARAK